MKGLALISSAASQCQEGRLLELAEWMGVPATRIAIGERPSIDQLVAEIGGRGCVAIGIETLALLRERLTPDVLQNFIEKHCTKLLVFSVGRSRPHRDLFGWLTDGAVSGLASAEVPGEFRMPDGARRFSGAFAGQRFGVKRPGPVSTFDLNDAGGVDVEKIMLADERRVFLRLERGSCELFLLALAQLPDINERLSPSNGVENHFDQLIPLLIFLRHSFGEVCWHGVQSTARLIIDDPLLGRRYGFLDYGALRKSMRTAGYATSMAFIPWNYWRTSTKKTAGIFGGDRDLSICVHGCDHTNKEFEDTNADSVQWKAETALRRMERHESRTGLTFDRVMVFPQGRFASPAMPALRTSGYLAAVNTSPFPTDVGAEPLAIADFLRPAIMKFGGFPLFQRRYPGRLVDFAFDIFLGRPALIVQHHEDFRDGYGVLEEFVAGLNGLAPQLAWGSLADQLMRSCMVRSVAEGTMEVRFFTRQFKFKNAQSHRVRLVFSKEEPDTSMISKVMVDGASVAFSVENGFLTFDHEADAGQAIDVTIVDRPRPSAPSPKWRGVSHTVAVSVRRGLSELRDNVLVKHPRLLAAATGLATKMKVTGKDDRHERA